MYRRIRNICGFLGMILPCLSAFGAFIYRGSLPADFWKTLSISATYYVTPALPAVLTAASIVLMTYDGYDSRDNIVTTVSGVLGLGIVLFPCSCSAAPEVTGYFGLPVAVSNVIHCACAVAFFLLLAYNSLFLFTLGDGEKTDMKKIRDWVYRVCGIGMALSMALMVIPVKFNAKTYTVEALALFFFGISWLTKGGAFRFLNDETD